MTDQNKEPQERTEDYFEKLTQERAEIEQGGITDTLIEMTERARESIGATEGYTAALMRSNQQIRGSLLQLGQAHAEYIKSEQWAEACRLYPDLLPFDAYFISYMVPDLIECEPELKELLREYQDQAGQEMTFRQLLYEPAPDDMDTPLIEYFILKARRIRERKGLPKVKYEPARNQQIQINIDKAMQMLFNPRTSEKAARLGIPLYVRDKVKGYKLKRGEIPGQLSFFPVSYEGGGKEEITLYYALDYDGDMLKKLGLPEETTAEDFFILSVIGNTEIAGNIEVSPNKLYRDLTGREPNAKERTRFVNRLMKMAGTMVDIDDREVMEAWGQDTYNQYYGQLAPLEFINERFVVNGGIANCRIKITNFPRVLQTGQKIGQYITIPKSLLYVKKYPQGKDKDGKKKKPRAVKRTPRFYELLMILLKEIAMIKNGKRINKILYSTLYKELDITEKDYYARKDIIDMLYVILEHFKREQWITGYKEETTKSTGEVGVKIEWRNTGKGSAQIERKGRRKAPARTPDNKSKNPR